MGIIEFERIINNEEIAAAPRKRSLNRGCVPTSAEGGVDFTIGIARDQPSVFGIGIDDVNLTLTGKSTPTTASCTGAAKQAPGVTFEAVLVRVAD